MSQDPVFLKAKNISTTHGFFTRIGGLSQGIYDSLNCAWGSKDDLKLVMNNRALVVQSLGNHISDLLSAAQVHSNRVQIVDKIWTRERAPEVDAMVTTHKGIALGILSADCAPVLFHDSAKGIIGAAHAGWKGAFSGVLENTLKAMESLGSNIADIDCAIGPCIHQASYEVDVNFRKTFLNHDPAFAIYFTDSVNEGHYQFDLVHFIEDKLNAHHVKSVQTSMSDTYKNEEQFFSFRRTTHRQEADYGRQISVIALD